MKFFPITYTVRLRENYPVQYPDICVVCGGKCKERNKIREYPSGYFGLHKWVLFLTEKIEVPSHNHCIGKLRKKLFFRNAMSLILASCALVIAIYFDWNKFESLFLFLFIMIPFVIFWVKNPLPFEFSIDGKWKLYSFKNKFYAETFAHWNNSSIQETY